MLKDATSVLVGGLIGFVSSLLTAFLTYLLQGRRLKAQLARDDELRRQERAREDQLRTEEREREDRRRIEEMRRQSVQRETDMLWKDIERMEEMYDQIPPNNHMERARLEKSIKDWTSRRQKLLDDERKLVYGDRKQLSQSGGN